MSPPDRNVQGFGPYTPDVAKPPADAGTGGGPPDSTADRSEATSTTAGAPADPPATRARGCFKIVEITAVADPASDSPPCPDGAFYLVPDPDADTEATPAQQAALYTQVGLTLQVLQALYLKGQRKDKKEAREVVGLYHRQLRQIADIGLTGPWARPGVATPMLAYLQAEILASEAPAVKNAHMESLAKVCARFGVPALGLTLLARGFESLAPVRATLVRWEPGLLSFAETMSLGLLIAGASLGVWLSFSARKTALEFDDLLVLEEDLLRPRSRVALAVSLTLVLALLLQAGMLTLGVGGFKTEDILTHPLAAAILGVVCGFSEKSLTQTLAAQAGRILKEPEKTPAGKVAVGGAAVTS